jgi:hypothetical protein
MGKLREPCEFLTTLDELGNIQNTKMSQRVLGKFEPAKISVTVAPNREKRSLDQNAYYWGLVLPRFASTRGIRLNSRTKFFRTYLRLGKLKVERP